MENIDDLLSEVEGTEVKLSFSELKKGTLYDIRSLEKTCTVYQGKNIDGMKANISLEGFNFFTYLPSNYIRMNANLLAAINAAGLTNKKWTVCFYGSIGKSNVGRLHKPGQGINGELLSKVANLTENDKKRPGDDLPGPSSKR